ncbi:hypothetical protein TorRG33x02_048420 [Trema orientale]|uniref:RNase H type-1 domain-containing protein n=1 Tax=Trema orientale TaxID=63057 RepID=A0A2P5FNE3_TREOI|nr:hypothetical protein TorRG33x02_048420 [Trema orientale]
MEVLGCGRVFSEGKNLLVKGLRWRIGDGSTVKVFHNPWLPNPSSFKPITPSFNDDLQIFELICVVLWAIWTRRNNKLFNGVSKDTLELSDLCQYYLEELQACKLHIELAPSVPHSSGIGVWNKPWVGCLKLNVDTVVYSGLNFIGVGGTIRDHEGAILVCWALKISGRFDILTSELLAIREGVRLAIEFGCPLHEIEYDSLLTITAINHVQP